jgi:2-methylcitrate dehydratase PrpD
MTAETAITRFVAGLRYEALPDTVIAMAKRSLVNFFAVAFAGSDTAAIATLSRQLQALSGAGGCTAIGRGESLAPLDAAFINCASANVFDFDDTHLPTIIHPTAPVAAALLALAEMQPLDGRAFLAALVVGMEVECHLGLALHPHHYRRGWHITSTCGVFGAAMACGHALGLDAGRLLAALGHASAQSSGLVETLGTDSKSIGMGNAARNGLLAALLARDGLIGPEQPLSGERGFLAVYGDPSTPSLANLGLRWETLNNTFKPYPCGIVLNPVIDACLELRQQPGFATYDIASVAVTGGALLRERADRPQPANGREAQVSLQHAVAVTLLRGRPSVAEFSDAAVAATDVAALRQKVRTATKIDRTIDSVTVEITIRDGQKFTVDINPEARATLGLTSNAEISEKFITLTSSQATPTMQYQLLKTLWSIETRTVVGSLMHFPI